MTSKQRDIHIWFPRPKWRTHAWHIRDEEFNQKGYLFIQYIPQHDEIGAPTGKGHLMVWERWPSFGHGKPSETMPEREALKLLQQMEADCDKEYKKVDDRKYDLYRALSEEYYDAKPYREHPQIVAEKSTVLSTDTTSMKPLRFNAVARPSGEAEKPVAAAEISDDRTWRTDAFLVENHGYYKINYTTFCEIRPHPDRDKDNEGLCHFVTWRMGEHSVYCNKDETSIRSAMERISYFEWEHKECPKASPTQGGPLALPKEYFAAADYHTHPSLNPEDVVVGRKVTAMKSLKLKPK